MSSLVTNISNNIKDVIDLIPFGEGTLSSEVGLDKDFNLSSVSAMKIIICPTGFSREVETRGDSVGEVTVTIAVLEKIADSDLDSRIEMVEGIASRLCNATLAYGQCTGVDFSPLYDIAMMTNQRLFESVIHVTVKVIL